MFDNEKTSCKSIRLFGEEMEAIVPSNYQPDSNDRHFRREIISATTFHSIGHGTQGIVIAALLDIGGTFVRVAAKRYDVAKAEGIPKDNRTKSNGYTKILRELQNTQYLVHENIVQMMDSFWEASSAGDIRFVWIVTERMDVDLAYYFERLKKHDKSPNPTLRDHRQLAAMLVQVFRALDFLHERGVMHRDLTPKNIGLNKENFQIKLLDFGVCGPTNSKGIHSVLPTLPVIYQPLEVALMDRYDCGVDVWSAGLIALEMLWCKLMMPFDEKATSVKERILDVLGLPNDHYASFFGDSLRSHRPRKATLEQEIGSSFQRLDRDRQSLTQENLMDLLKRIFEVNRQVRLTASECLEHPYLNEMNRKLELAEVDVPAVGSIKRDKELLKSTLMKFSKKVAQ